MKRKPTKKKQPVQKQKLKNFVCNYCEDGTRFVVDEYGCIHCRNCNRVLGNDTRVEPLIKH